MLGNQCHDELDHDTCDDGLADRGFGCEPKDMPKPVIDIWERDTEPSEEDNGSSGNGNEDSGDSDSGNDNVDGDDNANGDEIIPPPPLDEGQNFFD